MTNSALQATTRMSPCRHTLLFHTFTHRLAGPGEPIYGQKLSPAEVLRRISSCHEPYHRTVSAEMNTMCLAFGKVWC